MLDIEYSVIKSDVIKNFDCNYFQLKVPFGVTFLQNIYFFKKNYPMILFESLGTPL